MITEEYDPMYDPYRIMRQIAEWNLPTRPTKKSDTRSKSFDGESVEVDAIEPDHLRSLCEEVIRRNIDGDKLERLQRVEAAERETLETLVSSYTHAGQNDDQDDDHGKNKLKKAGA